MVNGYIYDIHDLSRIRKNFRLHWTSDAFYKVHVNSLVIYKSCFDIIYTLQKYIKKKKTTECRVYTTVENFVLKFNDYSIYRYN